MLIKYSSIGCLPFSQNQYFGCGFLFPVVSPFRFISFLDLLQPDVLSFTNHIYTVVGKLKLPLMVVV